ncbi:putative syntaxin 8 [Heterostelium album PN500]|uniref:Putative syntaxin 8 n=1 Tax=Heterostelium pallidum (strain ATCC 26659 / Pp 5 / PN500) TaxID=670386 RepID=D3BEX3_HETP5|nr:putative syntaxin 8 [Heterostelium album PN500]EFA80454.1 putative syntaxin 8 [Heterostelium album PN500]|eukprot:XP_020432574.1 putative syntaxin 8 [Heterostelium album PN500]
MGDSWEYEYDNASRQLQQLVTEVKSFEVQQRNNPGAVQKQTAPNIRRALSNLSNDLARLKDALVYGNLRITDKEKMRRNAMVEQLGTQKNNLTNQFENAANNNFARNELMGDASSKRAWGKQAKDNEFTQNFNNQQLFNQNNTVMQEHDQALDLLSNSLMRQKNMASAMNTELEIHNQLLDDVEIGVDRTTSRIQHTNSKMNILKENASSCGMIICIVLLIIFIIVLLATGE